MHHLVRFVIALCLLVVAGMAPVHAEPSYPWPAYSVLPIFFVPKDWDVNSSEVQAEAAALRSAMAEIRQFYAHALGGNTFLLNDLAVVQANGPKENYAIQWTGGDIYADGITIGTHFVNHLLDELGPLGYPFTGQWNINGYAVVIFVKGPRPYKTQNVASKRGSQLFLRQGQIHLRVSELFRYSLSISTLRNRMAMIHAASGNVAPAPVQ